MHHARLERIHQLRLRLIRIENNRMERIISYQNRIMERMAERTAAIQQATRYRRAELDRLRATRRRRRAAEAAAEAEAAEAVENVAEESGVEHEAE